MNCDKDKPPSRIPYNSKSKALPLDASASYYQCWKEPENNVQSIYVVTLIQLFGLLLGLYAPHRVNLCSKIITSIDTDHNHVSIYETFLYSFIDFPQLLITFSSYTLFFPRLNKVPSA